MQILAYIVNDLQVGSGIIVILQALLHVCIYALWNLVYMQVSIEHPVKYVTVILKLYTLSNDCVDGWGGWDGGGMV